jgi:hypothetical protein
LRFNSLEEFRRKESPVFAKANHLLAPKANTAPAQTHQDRGWADDGIIGKGVGLLQDAD